MQRSYADRLIRFGLGLLATVILLMLLVRLSPGATPDLSLSLRTQQPVAEMVTQVLPGTVGTVATSLAFALPLALLLGVPAGLRPGGWLDRLLQAPAAMLMGVPAYTVGLGMMLVLVFGSRSVSVPGAAKAAIVILLAGWMGRAIRDGMASVREDGLRLPVGRAVVAALGRFLQQTGSLLVVIGILEMMGGLPGLWRLLITGTMTRDLPLIRIVLWVILLIALVGHLVGDLLVTAAKGSRSPVSRLSGSWLVIGGLLVAGMLLMAFLGSGRSPTELNLAVRLQPAGPDYPLGTDTYGRDLLARVASGARVSLVMAMAGTLIATVPGAVWAGIGKVTGRWGAAILSPRVAVPGLLGPLAAGLVASLIFGTNVLTLIIALGVASIGVMAQAFRTLFENLPGALYRALGLLVLTFWQILMAESILSYTGIGVQPPTASLGNLIFEATNYLRVAPHLLWTAVPGLLGLMGLFLVGQALAEGGAE